ncbi:uncharacterized protein LOC122991086 [Thunnus albacares]|uniref:uncharacterized protein LOC122991086 n=1 Tax=Thunnus albacares TaxID=8236 RepID=UPI001CF6D9FA|nr:uncharacterized protein LOC122991086 [Thunnus albacares]
MMTETVRVAVPGATCKHSTTEQLGAARAPLKEPFQPDQPMAFHPPEDASGQAATCCGPLAPQLFDVINTSANAASSFSVTDTPSASTSAAATASAPSEPRSTAWQRKVWEELQRQAQEEGALLNRSRKDFQHFLCKCCGQPKTKEYGHSHYRGEHFCSWAEGRSVEEWLAEKRSQEPKKTEATQPATLLAPKTARNIARKTAPQPPP